MASQGLIGSLAYGAVVLYRARRLAWGGLFRSLGVLLALLVVGARLLAVFA